MLSSLFGAKTPAQPVITDEELQNLRGQVAAMNKSQAVIEFTLDGKILTANENFLNALGYTLAEVQGQHHSMFVDPTERSGPQYRAFWEKLGRGEFDAAQYKRIGKNNREIWIQASYNPIFDKNGRPYKVVKFATDITAEKERSADAEGQIAAINKAQAVIHFSLDGKVLDANPNFCETLGYSLAEIKGQHHSLFVDPAERSSPEYRAFWEKLGRGQFDAGQYKRIAKGGRAVWIQASYNPIFDASGRPFKVVKFATDITAQVHASQVLNKAVAETEAVVGAACDGDLTMRIATDDKDGQILQLCEGLNALLENMASAISEIRVTSDAVSTAAKEIAQGNADLSSRTEEQASSVEETASTMEELTSTVRQNTENSDKANNLAAGAQTVAEKGGQVVAEVVTTMAAIQQSSNRIADIIGVIDGIAFQTNILALNAAVEAARAGEQGRGFAVVATEVRNLAQRSAAAAKEIKTLISDSMDKVQNGSKLVDQAGKTMEEVVGNIKSVARTVSDIAAASREQASGIEQVGTAIAQMDEVTQQNAALVEEAAAAAESLDEQSNNLVRIISRFVIQGGGGNARAAAVVPIRRQGPRDEPRRNRPAALPGRSKALAAPVEGEWEEF